MKPVGQEKVRPINKAGQQKRNVRAVVLLREITKHAAKSLVVEVRMGRRQAHADNHSDGAVLRNGGEYLSEIVDSLVERNAAKCVVGTEFKNYDIGPHVLDSLIDTSKAALGRFASAAGIHYQVGQGLFRQTILKQGRPTARFRNAVATRQRVTKDENDSALSRYRGTRAQKPTEDCRAEIPRSGTRKQHDLGSGDSKLQREGGDLRGRSGD